MNKKKLPKAITRTADGMRAAAGADQWVDAPAKPVPLSKLSSTSLEASAGEVARPVTLQASTSVDAAWRQQRAHAIVERYAAYAAVGGMIPLPLVNAASITASIVRMVKALSDHYGVPFERDRARTIVVGLAMGVFPAGVGAITASTLFSVVPGANVIGLVTSSLVGAGCTRSIGRIFVEHFETGATLADFPLIERH